MPPVTPIPVVCAVIVRQGLVLATRRGPGMTHAGQWEFPGGKVDPGESESDALVREIREELSLEVVPETRLPACLHHYPDKSIELIPYLCRVAGGEVTLHEHDAFRWCTPAELPELAWAPADVPVVREVVERLTVDG